MATKCIVYRRGPVYGILKWDRGNPLLSCSDSVVGLLPFSDDAILLTQGSDTKRMIGHIDAVYFGTALGQCLVFVLAHLRQEAKLSAAFDNLQQLVSGLSQRVDRLEAEVNFMQFLIGIRQDPKTGEVKDLVTANALQENKAE